MQRPRRFHLFAPALALALLLGGGGGSAVLAQDAATPEVDLIEPDADALPSLGDEAPYLDEGGDEIGLVTALELTDPFEDFGESFTVEEGTRYIALEVSVAATGAELAANASDFSLLTADGFVVGTASPARDITSGDVRDLERITVDVDDEVTGLIFFQIGADQEPGFLLWAPESERLLIVADLRSA